MWLYIVETCLIGHPSEMALSTIRRHDSGNDERAHVADVIGTIRQEMA